jgi:hypothetical protein
VGVIVTKLGVEGAERQDEESGGGHGVMPWLWLSGGAGGDIGTDPSVGHLNITGTLLLCKVVCSVLLP